VEELMLVEALTELVMEGLVVLDLEAPELGVTEGLSEMELLEEGV
jgi:hypothetical protein